MNAVTELKRDVSIQTNRVRTQELGRNMWIVTVEPNITREDLLLPQFWANIAKNLTQFDRIEVRVDDGSFFAEYLVLSCDRVSAYLKELTWYDLTEKSKSVTPEYEVKWRGPHGKHSVIRLKDKSLMIEHLASKAEAERWLTEYLGKI